MANNTKQADKLIQASLSGDVSCIEDLLSKNADVNCKNKHNQFPLLVASQNGHKEAVKLLIERGAHVNMESMKKVTSLSLASECGHHETVQILLENGAHIDHGVSDGRTPLMLASHNGHEETVRVLLSKNANVNARTFGKETALSYALKSKHGEVAKLLLPHVVDVDSKDSNRWTPLMLASLLGSADVTELLLMRGARVNLRTPKRSTALLLASSAGHVETVSVLLKYGADIDLQNDNCYSALLIASERGHKDVVKVLLSHNAEVDLYILSSGKTALILASENGYTQIVKLLLYDDKHENITQTSQARSSESQQRLEVSEGQDEKHRSRSAKINVVDTLGKNALTIASSRGDLEMVETLIQHGADVNRIEGENSALSRAVASRNVEIVRLLLKNNVTVLLEDLIQASKLGCLEILKLLIPHCVNIDPDWPKRHTDLFKAGMMPSNAPASPLWWAVKTNHANIVHLLLENGASIENSVMSGKERPALLIATIHENVEIVEALLKKGADVDVTSLFQHQSVTPLMLAIAAGHKELVRIFVKHGADICLKYDTGAVDTHFTCMDLAKAVGNQKIIAILKEEGSQCLPATIAAGTDPDFEFCFHSHKKPRSYPEVLKLVKSEYQALYQNLNDIHYQSYMEKEPLKDLFPSKENATDSDQESKDSNKPQLPEPQTPPTVNAAYKFLLPEAASWKNIGTLLDIDFGKLKSIEADKSKSQDALLEMLDEWLKKVDPRPPTWDDLVEAVKPFNESIAQQIREKHCRTM